jgi:hypothetical protein
MEVDEEGPGPSRPAIPNLKKRKLGSAQAAKARAKQQQKSSSALVFYLLQCFAWGEMPAVQVQKIAQLTHQDLQKSKEDESEDIEHDIAKLAKLGDGGRYPNHVYSELLGVVDHGKLPTAKSVPIPISNKSHRDGWENQPLKFVFPHELFASLYHDYPDLFRSRLCPGTSVLRGFWQSQEDHPQMEGHPIRDRPDYDKRAIPISFHGDGVPVTGLSCVCFFLLVFLPFSDV